MQIPVKYEGFRIGPEFVVGYGLDFHERFRNLGFLAVLNEHPETTAAREGSSTDRGASSSAGREQVRLVAHASHPEGQSDASPRSAATR